MDKVRQLTVTPLFWLQAAFFISLSAALGSIILSNVLDFLPCELCWWQRAFMYPLPFIFGAALAQKKTDVFWYGMPLVIVGAAVALYHYVLQMSPQVSSVCSASLVSCTEKQIELLGFMTIPFGSLLAFGVVGVCLLMLKRTIQG
ncbi:MAG: disulfide bond formation protein B [Candidatus Saccharimonadales bacterium]